MNPIRYKIPLTEYILFLKVPFNDTHDFSDVWYRLAYINTFYLSVALYNQYSVIFNCDYDGLLINED